MKIKKKEKKRQPRDRLCIQRSDVLNRWIKLSYVTSSWACQTVWDLSGCSSFILISCLCLFSSSVELCCISAYSGCYQITHIAISTGCCCVLVVHMMHMSLCGKCFGMLLKHAGQKKKKKRQNYQNAKNTHSLIGQNGHHSVYRFIPQLRLPHLPTDTLQHIYMDMFMDFMILLHSCCLETMKSFGLLFVFVYTTQHDWNRMHTLCLSRSITVYSFPFIDFKLRQIISMISMD